MQLTPLEQRLLGSLIEKALATPQSYPLSVNALTSAANQTTNREPVTDYDQAQVGEGIRELSGQSLVRAAYARRSSTPKYEHLLDEHLEIGTDQVAVLGVLLLRGPQTLGELRQRTDRMHHFAEIADMAETLGRLADHPFGALVVEMERQPGQKETRWVHLLGSGEAPAGDASGPATAVERLHPTTATPAGDELNDLHSTIRRLEEQVGAMAGQIEELQQAIGMGPDRPQEPNPD